MTDYFENEEFESVEENNNNNVNDLFSEAIIEESSLQQSTYELGNPKDYVDYTMEASKFNLSEMVVSEKSNRDGKVYNSRKCTLQADIDEMETTLVFYIENFNNYDVETDTLTVQGNNVLARLISIVKGCENINNRYVLKYNVVRDIINSLSDVEFTVRELVNVNGYKSWTIE